MEKLDVYPPVNSAYFLPIKADDPNFENTITNRFDAIFKNCQNQLVKTLIEYCWKVVTCQQTGLAMIKAGHLFSQRLGRLDFETTLKLEFSDGNTLELNPCYKEALKKDCVTLGYLLDETAGGDATIPMNCSQEHFLGLLAYLYGNELTQDNLKNPHLELAELVPLANYLDLRTLNDLFDQLKEEITNLYFSEKNIRRALNIYITVKRCSTIPAMRSLLENEFPDYFGRALAKVKLKDAKEKYIPLFNQSGVTAISLKGFHLSLSLIELLKDLNTLEYLNLSGSNITDDDLADLPKNLKKLNLADCKEITDEGIARLTRSRKYLKRKKNTKEEPCLLSELTLKSCVNITKFAIQYLPESLTHLNLTIDTYCNFKGFELLPRGITHLSFKDVYISDDEHFKDLPPNLISLDIPIFGCIIFTSLEHLPKSLISLKLNQWGKKNYSQELRFPPNLIRLELLNSGVTDEDLKKLPQTITHLDLSGSDCITDEGLKYLPKSLTSLKLARNPFNSKDGFKYLPESLEYLSLTDLKDMTVGELGHLQNLKVLHIEDCIITEETIKTLPLHITELKLSYCDVSDDDLKNLTKRLTNLISLDISDCPDITDQGLQVLPSTLINLNIQNCSGITSEGLKQLPPHLKILKAGGNYEILDYKWLKELPQGLAKLKLDCSTFTDKAVEFLPKNLRVLNLSWTKITSDCFKYLPRKLRKLNIQNCRICLESDLRNLPKTLVKIDIRDTMLRVNSAALQNVFKGVRVKASFLYFSEPTI